MASRARPPTATVRQYSFFPGPSPRGAALTPRRWRLRGSPFQSLREPTDPRRRTLPAAIDYIKDIVTHPIDRILQKSPAQLDRDRLRTRHRPARLFMLAIGTLPDDPGVRPARNLGRETRVRLTVAFRRPRLSRRLVPGNNSKFSGQPRRQRLRDKHGFKIRFGISLGHSRTTEIAVSQLRNSAGTFQP